MNTADHRPTSMTSMCPEARRLYAEWTMWKASKAPQARMQEIRAWQVYQEHVRKCEVCDD